MSIGQNLDMTLNSMEEIRFKRKHKKLIKSLAQKLPFSLEEIECLLLIYYKIQKHGGENQTSVKKVQIRDVLHSCFDITDEAANLRISNTLLKSTGPYVTMEEWVYMITLFLKGTFKKRLRHCYKCYAGMTFDGMITRDSMFNAMKSAIVTQSKEEDSEEVVKDLLEVLQKKMDVDRDGRISLDDYRTTVQAEPLIMECLGPCLPSRLAVHAFLTSFTEFRGKL